MGLVAELLGKNNGDSPGPSRTFAEVEGALVRLRSERAQARQALAEASDDRERLLLLDGSERKIEAADRAADAARLALERCEKIEPLLLAEIEDLRSTAKRERWRAFRKRHDEAARELARRLREALDKRAELIAIFEEARRAGFEHELASAFTPPPLAFNPEGVAYFEMAIERAREMGRPAPAPAPMTPAPSAIPKPRALAPPTIRPAALKPPKPAPPAPRPPREVKADANGNVRVHVLRAGLEIEGGKRTRVGETISLPLDKANALLRSAAVDLAEPEEGAA
jgi:hypothetical protein